MVLRLIRNFHVSVFALAGAVPCRTFALQKQDWTPLRLTLHWRYATDQFMHSLRIEPMTLALEWQTSKELTNVFTWVLFVAPFLDTRKGRLQVKFSKTKCITIHKFLGKSTTGSTGRRPSPVAFNLQGLVGTFKRFGASLAWTELSALGLMDGGRIVARFISSQPSTNTESPRNRLLRAGAATRSWLRLHPFLKNWFRAGAKVHRVLQSLHVGLAEKPARLEGSRVSGMPLTKAGIAKVRAEREDFVADSASNACLIRAAQGGQSGEGSWDSFARVNPPSAGSWCPYPWGCGWGLAPTQWTRHPGSLGNWAFPWIRGCCRCWADPAGSHCCSAPAWLRRRCWSRIKDWPRSSRAFGKPQRRYWGDSSGEGAGCVHALHSAGSRAWTCWRTCSRPQGSPRWLARSLTGILWPVWQLCGLREPPAGRNLPAVDVLYAGVRVAEPPSHANTAAIPRGTATGLWIVAVENKKDEFIR